jgi:hypothetical protein
MIKIILIVVGFIAGLVFCLSYNSKDLVEGFDGFDGLNKSATAEECPNILVRKDGRIELRNTKKANVPGVNPIYFENLEEYTEFIEWQRANGIICPILAFNQLEGANGEYVYALSKELSSNGMKKEMPLYNANKDDPPFNQGPYQGYDEENQNIGRNTILDKIDNDRFMKAGAGAEEAGAGTEVEVAGAEAGAAGAGGAGAGGAGAGGAGAGGAGAGGTGGAGGAEGTEEDATKIIIETTKEHYEF